jgi:agmatine deiminase
MPYHLPSEWEPHEATWLAWPHDRRDWPGKMTAVSWAFGEMVRKLVEGEIVRIMVSSDTEEQAAQSVLRRASADMGRVQFFRIPTDRAWARDMGPIFLRRGGEQGRLVVAGFRFNAWARYPDYQNDERVAALAAEALGMELVRPEHGGKGFVLEGGAIDTNGCGTLLTTEQVMLDNSQQARNPHLTKEELEAVLREWLGVSQIFYLGRGLTGDDTGGHVDDFCRFAGPQTVVFARETDPADVNYPSLADAADRLQDLRLGDGTRPEIIELPMPQALVFDGRRLPASYANFYIANAVVLVPTFNDPADRKAIGILADLFPGRKVVGIHAVDLVLGRGAIHCLTQQQPDVRSAGFSPSCSTTG